MTNKKEAFKRDCRIVNMKMEYPGYTGEIMWMVVSDLTEEEIISRYPVEIKPFLPFIYMTREMFEPVVDWDRNNRKFSYRAHNLEDIFGYTDDMVEHFHPELIVNPDLTELRLYVKQALLKLTEVQRRRIVKYIYEEMTIEELQEGILAKMAKNGPITDQMRKDVEENIYRNSLLNWINSFR